MVVIDPPTHAEVEDALQRLLADPRIGGNARHAKLLRHLVTESLAGHTDRLKGTAIAIDVFDRSASFDPQVDGIVRSEARRLRHALASYYVERGAGDPIVIHVPTGGYVARFERRAAEAGGAKPVAPDASAGPEPPSGGQAVGAKIPTPPPSEQAGRARRAATGPVRGSALRTFVLAAAALACIVAAVLFLRAPLRDLQAGSAAPPPTFMSPAVLIEPFEAAGDLEDLDTLAAGITARLIADLMRFPNFRVYSFEDSLTWGGGTAPQPHDRETGPHFVIRGVVRGDPQSLSITARLVDTADGAVVWSEAIERPLAPGAIATMEADIAGEIAAKLGGAYGIVGTRMSEANAGLYVAMPSFTCVLNAHAYRYNNRVDLYAPARACLEDTVRRDPDYAEAWALLAFLRLDGGRFGYEAGTAEERSAAYRSAQAAAARAMSLEPNSALAVNALAHAEHYAGRFEDSRRYSERAVELNPNDPHTLAFHGWRLSLRGRLDEGIPFIDRAIERSVRPSPYFFHVIAVDRLMADDMEGMLIAAQHAAADGSSVSDALLAIAYGGLGAEREAQAALERMAARWPLLGQDPAAAFGIHNLHPDLIAAIVEGLRRAGWNSPAERNANVDMQSSD